MMLVPSHLKESPIAGKGIFAAIPISKGTPVWEFTPQLDLAISLETYQQLPPIQQEYLNIYTYFTEGNYYLCADHARFMNHSDDANTIEEGFRCLASRDIAAGEEITCNYFHFDDHARRKLGLE